MPTCFWCGQERRLEILEWWDEERAWMLDTCCEGYYEAMIEELNDEELLASKEWRRGFAAWWYDQTGQRARRPFISRYGGIRVDYGLDFTPVTLAEAKEFIRRHHRHNPPPLAWHFGLALRNGPDLVAVAMVGRPVARMIDATTTVEVNRLCVDPRLEPELVWNACSMLYAEAAREAKRRGYSKVITYTLETEVATSLKACGWDPVAKTKGGSWNTPSRPRKTTTPTCKKIRWERVLGTERRAA